MNQEEAAGLPVQVRIAGYAKDHGLDFGTAYDHILELGLQAVLEHELVAHGAEWLPPIYLYASYLRLMGEAEAQPMTLHVSQLDSQQLLRLSTWFKGQGLELVTEMLKTAGTLTPEQEAVVGGHTPPAAAV